MKNKRTQSLRLGIESARDTEGSFWPTLAKHRDEISELATRQASERESEEELLTDLPVDETQPRRAELYHRQYGELLELLGRQGAYLRSCESSELHSLVLREREEILRLLSPSGRSVIELLQDIPPRPAP